MFSFSPITKRRYSQFKNNRRGYWSFWIFMVLFILSLGADFIANDKPLLIGYKNDLYLPLLNTYPETTFGGDFATEADYRDSFVKDLIEADGWMLWPPIPYHYDTINYDLRVPAPAPPSPSPSPPSSSSSYGAHSPSPSMSAG